MSMLIICVASDTGRMTSRAGGIPLLRRLG
jgi:hypothetical protein